LTEDPIHLPIARYHQGLIEGDPDLVLAALGDEFIMFNGNFSGEPTAWQAHMFLAGPTLRDWPTTFLREAGPYLNRYEIVHTHIRGRAAVVVTRDTGRNRFREWTNEMTTWLLGQREGEWKIVGYFVRDIRNPE
jgi:hypothetical protein